MVALGGLGRHLFPGPAVDDADPGGAQAYGDPGRVHAYAQAGDLWGNCPRGGHLMDNHVEKD